MQQTFLGIQGTTELRKLNGASGGLLLDVIGQGYFAAKAFEAGRPYTLVSEWVCADIATFLRLPTPARRIIMHNGQRYFGLEWRSDAIPFQSGIEAKLLNPEAIAGMLVFDVFVCNRDRHAGNMLFQRPSTSSDSYELCLIDHSHALIGDMSGLAAQEHFIQSNNDPISFLAAVPPQLRELVQTDGELDFWIRRVESISREQLVDSVAGIPSEWRPSSDDTPALIDFLLVRKSAVRSLVLSASSMFPNLSHP